MGKRARRDPIGHKRRGKGYATATRVVERTARATRAPTDDDDQLDPSRAAYETPFDPHGAFGNVDAELPDGRTRVYASEGMNCLRAATAMVLDVPYDQVPAGGDRGGSGLADPAVPYMMLAEWADWAAAAGLVPAVHTSIHPQPTDRAWWAAVLLRVRGYAVHLNVYVMHFGQVVHSPLLNWEGVPEGPWYALTVDDAERGGFPLREHLAEFTPDEFMRPIVTQAFRLERDRR